METAEHFQKDYPLTLLFSAVDDKDYTDMIRTVAGRIRFQHVIVTQVGGYRKVPSEQLADISGKRDAFAQKAARMWSLHSEEPLNTEGKRECFSA